MQPMPIGSRVVAVRAIRQVSASKLAALLDVSPTHLTNVLAGRATASEALLQRLRAWAGPDWDWMCGTTDTLTVARV